MIYFIIFGFTDKLYKTACINCSIYVNMHKIDVQILASCTSILYGDSCPSPVGHGCLSCDLAEYGLEVALGGEIQQRRDLTQILIRKLEQPLLQLN